MLEKLIQKSLLTRQDLLDLGVTGSNVTWLRREQRGLMPRRVRLGGTRVCWDKAEIVQWLDELRANRARHVYADYA